MRRLAGWSAVPLALTVVACSSAAGQQGNLPGSARHPTQPAGDAAAPRPVGVLGSFWVGHRWMRITERAHRGVTGAWLTRRLLLIEVMYPATSKPTASKQPPPAKGRFPLLAFAPGFMQCGGPYSPMLRSWASAGYVVVTVNFPKSDCKVGAAATESDMVNQPGDMSYAITRVLRGPFSVSINPHQIAVTGQSDGGDTVGAIAANTCCGDRRVIAVAVLSGAEWPPMPGKYFTRKPVPMLFAQGSADRINWPGCSVQMYRADRARARYYLDLFGAGHVQPYWGVNRFERVMVRVGLAFFDRYVLGQASGGPAMRRDGNVRNVAALYGAGRGNLTPGPCNN